MGKKMIIVPRGTHPDGPYRGAVAGDRIVLPYMEFSPFTVAGQRAHGAGGVGYCSNGAAGDACGAVHDGTIWRQLTMGNEIAEVDPVEFLFSGGQDDFHRVLSPASAPTNPDNAVRPPGTVGGLGKFYSIWATPDGQTIWLGGEAWGVLLADANTFWRSIDGGSSWTNECALHPSANLGYVHSIFGFDSSNIWACGPVAGGNGVILGWTGALWSASAPYGLSLAGGYPANCVWGSSPTDMYCVVATGPGPIDVLYQNTGASWVGEGSAAGSLRNVLTPTDSLSVGIVGDGATLWVAATPSGTNTLQVWKGTFGGADWVLDHSAANHKIYGAAGRCIGIDETGEVWVMAFDTTGTFDMDIWRRNPGTGVWSLANTVNGTAGTASHGLYVIDSMNIAACADGWMSLYDGTTWYDYYTGALGLGWLWPNPTYGVWGRYA